MIAALEKASAPSTEKVHSAPPNFLTRSATLVFRNAQNEISKFKSVLESIPGRLKVVGKNGRGPCSGCLNGTDDHNGGSKCKMRLMPGFNPFTYYLNYMKTLNNKNIASASSGF